MPLPAASVDAVISNGVFNLAPDKTKVFREAARLLKSGGRLAISDIVTEVQLPEIISATPTLWAACIGGAAQQDKAIASRSRRPVSRSSRSKTIRPISSSRTTRKARRKKFGVKSVSLLAVKP